MLNLAKKGAGLLAPIALLVSCKRDLPVQPSPEQPQTTVSQSLSTRSLNLFSGIVPNFPVTLAQVASFNNFTGLNAPGAVASDANGNIYVADQGNNVIRKIDPNFNWSVFAGTGGTGHTDGPAASATFRSPSGVAVGPDGSVYVADLNNNCIRKITPDNVVHTFSGSGVAGFADGPANLAKFDMPAGVAVDANGTVYVADYNNNRIRRINPAGGVTQWAGSTAGFKDDTGSHAMFNHPEGIAIDPTGTAYVADIGNHRIRKIRSGVVTTLAGSGTPGFIDGTGTAASFNFPSGVTTDGAGTIFVTDKLNNAIRKITPTGVVTTVAGSGDFGFVDGNGTQAQFAAPMGLTIDPSGNMYIADMDDNRVRIIRFLAGVSTLAGNGNAGYVEQKGFNAFFNQPAGTAVDAAGNVYVADGANNRIRKITPAGVTSLLAGSGTAAFAEGTGAAASFNEPVGIAVDATGNVYVADINNRRIRKITPGGVVSTFAGGSLDPNQQLSGPSGVAVDAAGNVYVADGGLVFRFTPAGVGTILMHLPKVQTGFDTFITGRAWAIAVDAAGQQVFVSDTQIGVIWRIQNGVLFQFAGEFKNPRAFFVTGLALDAAGNLYASNTVHNQITEYNPSGTAIRVVGSANATPTFLDAPDPLAHFNTPSGLALNQAAGILYIADRNNNRIRMMNE